MAKKERKEVDARFANMPEKQVREEYLQTLGEVYKEKGILAGVGYELKSIGYSLGKMFGNVPDQAIVTNDNHKYESYSYPDIPTQTRGYADWASSKRAIERRKAERKAFVLRGSKGLEATTAAASILGLVGGAFFLSANMTGNAIADYSTETVSYVGIFLFVIAVIFAFLWLSLKKKKKVVVKSKKKRK